MRRAKVTDAGWKLVQAATELSTASEALTKAYLALNAVGELDRASALLDARADIREHRSQLIERLQVTS